jgi:beta-phosphoglucomutase-like phosphatase (HAD superfamily)
MNIEALIFDVDGTLADTEDAHRRAFNRAFADHGLDWDWSPDVYVDLLRIAGGRERISAFIDALEVSANERARLAALVPSLHARKTDHYTRGIGGAGLVLREGIARLLDDGQARGCRLAIASTTSAANIDSLVKLTLGANGLERFSVIACGDQVRAKKPAADIYLLVLEQLGVPPDRAVAFEDSANGLRSAQHAGIFTVVAPTYWTLGDDFASADLLLPRLGEPASPIEGEPGHALQVQAWLTLDELELLRTTAPGCTVPAQQLDLI